MNIRYVIKKMPLFVSLFLFCFILFVSSKKFQNLTFNSSNSVINIPLKKCVPASVNFTEVKSQLEESKAYCSLDNLLFDGSGKMVYFYYLKECKFSEPSEVIKKQDIEIDGLNGAYKVIKIYCKNS